MCVKSLGPCLTLCDPHGLLPARLLYPWDFPGKNTGVCCHLLLEGIFPIQESNSGLLRCRQILYHLSCQCGCVSPNSLLCIHSTCAIFILICQSYLNKLGSKQKKKCPVPDFIGIPPLESHFFGFNISLPRDTGH